MSLTRTPKAAQELSSRERTLSLKDRAALLLADGQKTAAELAALVRCAEADIQRLIAEGYLSAARPAAPSAAKPASAPSSAAAPATAVTGSGPKIDTAVSADRFEGPRSLASARLFLFDLVERLFARRAPEQAEALRERLRNARELEAMLAIAEDMLNDIAAQAGAERAQSIAERLALTLPEGSLQWRPRDLSAA